MEGNKALASKMAVRKSARMGYLFSDINMKDPAARPARCSFANGSYRRLLPDT